MIGIQSMENKNQKVKVKTEMLNLKQFMDDVYNIANFYAVYWLPQPVQRSNSSENVADWLE